MLKLVGMNYFVLFDPVMHTVVALIVVVVVAAALVKHVLVVV